MRKRIFEIVELAEAGDLVSRIYDLFMMACIFLSLIPLCFKNQTTTLAMIDRITVAIFIVDYILRLATSDYRLKSGKKSFLRYPFTPLAIIDLLSILPSLTMMSSVFKMLKIFRLVRTLRAFRAFRTFRYSKNIDLIMNVVRTQKDALIAVCFLAVGYILISALVIFNAEPNTFHSFFDAVYWATVSLTTVGYGDIFATSTIGRIITMISSVFGIAIIALPAGIITAGYMNEIQNTKKRPPKI